MASRLDTGLILAEPQKLVLTCGLSPGDIVMLTAAVRDLHLAHPGRYLTDVQTPAGELWDNNPYITRLSQADPDIQVLEMHYPLIHQSNFRPYHFIHGYIQFLEEKLQLRIPVTAFKGDIYLSDLERNWLSQVQEQGYSGPFWIMVAGGKFDFTAKWWDPKSYQKVVDHFRGRLPFVQIGSAEHWHPPLQGVLSLIGKTDTRQFVRLMYHSDGVVCPVTFAMHLAAAVPTRPARPKNRAAVVIAGGREPAQWEAYPHHQFINTNGALWCCDNGGCWKSRCQTVGDGDAKDQDLCVLPVEITPQLKIPHCMNIIRAEDVIRRIELYMEGGSLRYTTGSEWSDFAMMIRMT
jgi:ADP-heptose:LPS heptosyltransferase